MLRKVTHHTEIARKKHYLASIFKLIQKANADRNVVADMVKDLGRFWQHGSYAIYMDGTTDVGTKV